MNETVMVASSMKVDFDLSAMRVNLDNLFNGNKVLGKRRGNIKHYIRLVNKNYVFLLSTEMIFFFFFIQFVGRTVNTFLNQNALEVVSDLKENIGENLSTIFKQIMNDAFSHMPTKLWLQDD